MRMGFYGSSLLSSYWNGAATYYRGMIRALAARGHTVTFFEPRAFGRQERADIAPPEWCEVVVYEADTSGLARVVREARRFDVVVKTSGVGVLDTELLEGLGAHLAPQSLFVFWDVDAPATQGEMADAPDHPLRRILPTLDLVLTYGGGPPVIRRYRELGARACHAIYNALDPETHHPAGAEPRFVGDLAFLGNRLPDREARVDAFFLEAARRAPDRRFILGGSGWEPDHLPRNVRLLGHVPTRDHNAFNASPRAVLNVARDSMAKAGFSPATRVFEAAGAGACLITDAWEGIDMFLEPGREVLVARDGAEVAGIIDWLSLGHATRIGAAARARVLREHTYAQRAEEVESILLPALPAARVA